MYRTCIFCSADLGSNDSIEEFPVGRSIAFDAWKGRLWAVCPRCARWNLAPIEERWEAVEEAEKRFRDARLRAQSENVGLAKLPDGTRLVRIGEALPGELAAWRYGDQLVRRFRAHLPLQMAGVAGMWAVNGLIGTVALPLGLVVGGSLLVLVGPEAAKYWRSRQVAFRLPAERSPTGTEVRILRRHLHGLRVVPDEGGGIALEAYGVRGGSPTGPADLRLEGGDARTLLGRAMIHSNRGGATRKGVARAVSLLALAGSADEYLRRVAERRLRVFAPVTTPQFMSSVGHLGRPKGTFPQEGLALEMALHEATERRALEGELAVLEAAWRDAEEVAAIADALPDDPPDRLKGA